MRGKPYHDLSDLGVGVEERLLEHLENESVTSTDWKATESTRAYLLVSRREGVG